MNKISMRVMMLLVMVILAVTYWAGGRNLRVEAASSSTTAKKGQATPTFNKAVVRILQKNCQTCHHPGDIGPFSMMSYKETRPWAKSIREQVLLRKMPPWKPIQGCGDFRDVRALSDADIQTLVAWADGGSPEGSPADLPPPMNFPDGWPLGAPDLVVNPQSDYSPANTQVTSSFLTSRATVQRRQQLGLTLTGIRNTIPLLVSQGEDQSALASTSSNDDFSQSNIVRQRGFSLNYSHRLSDISNLNALASRQESTNSGTITGTGNLKATTTIYQINLSTKLGAKTTGALSARRSEFDSSTNPYTENAIIGSVFFVY